MFSIRFFKDAFGGFLGGFLMLLGVVFFTKSFFQSIFAAEQHSDLPNPSFKSRTNVPSLCGVAGLLGSLDRGQLKLEAL